jgi:hypothetical protein
MAQQFAANLDDIFGLSSGTSERSQALEEKYAVIMIVRVNTDNS